MHNKLLVADNRFTVSGGHNTADEYFMRSADANFIDMDVLSTGPVVRDRHRAGRYRRDRLRMGVQLHELSPDLARETGTFGDFGKLSGRLRAKVAVIDRRQLFVGSLNLDARSAWSTATATRASTACAPAATTSSGSPPAPTATRWSSPTSRTTTGCCA